MTPDYKNDYANGPLTAGKATAPKGPGVKFLLLAVAVVAVVGYGAGNQIGLPQAANTSYKVAGEGNETKDKVVAAANPTATPTPTPVFNPKVVATPEAIAPAAPMTAPDHSTVRRTLPEGVEPAGAVDEASDDRILPGGYEPPRALRGEPVRATAATPTPIPEVQSATPVPVPVMPLAPRQIPARSIATEPPRTAAPTPAPTRRPTPAQVVKTPTPALAAPKAVPRVTPAPIPKPTPKPVPKPVPAPAPTPRPAAARSGAACRSGESSVDCSARLASAILAESNVRYVYVSTKDDLRATANRQTITSTWTCGNTARLHPALLYALQQAASPSGGNYKVTLTNIITPHGCDPYLHPKGRAFDVDNLISPAGVSSNAGHIGYGDNQSVDRAFAEYIARYLPSGGGIGQANKCFPASLPAGIRSDFDVCTHIHVDIGTLAP